MLTFSQPDQLCLVWVVCAQTQIRLGGGMTRTCVWIRPWTGTMSAMIRSWTSTHWWSAGWQRRHVVTVVVMLVVMLITAIWYRPFQAVMVRNVRWNTPTVPSSNRSVCSTTIHPFAGHREGGMLAKWPGVCASMNQVLTSIFFLQISVDCYAGHYKSQQLWQQTKNALASSFVISMYAMNSDITADINHQADAIKKIARSKCCKNVPVIGDANL